MILGNIFLLLLLSASAFRLFPRILSTRGRRALQRKLQNASSSGSFRSKASALTVGSIFMGTATKNSKEQKEKVVNGPNFDEKYDGVQEYFNDQLLELRIWLEQKRKLVNESSNEEIIKLFKRNYWIPKDKERFENTFNELDKKFSGEMQKLNSTTNEEILKFINELRQSLMKEIYCLFDESTKNLIKDCSEMMGIKFE